MLTALLAPFKQPWNQPFDLLDDNLLKNIRAYTSPCQEWFLCHVPFYRVYFRSLSNKYLLCFLSFSFHRSWKIEFIRIIKIFIANKIPVLRFHLNQQIIYQIKQIGRYAREEQRQFPTVVKHVCIFDVSWDEPEVEKEQGVQKTAFALTSILFVDEGKEARRHVKLR